MDVEANLRLATDHNIYDFDAFLFSSKILILCFYQAGQKYEISLVGS